MEAGLDRESLDKALSSSGAPEFAASLKVVRALGLRLRPLAAAGLRPDAAAQPRAMVVRERANGA